METATILDQARFEARARLIDVVALGVFLVAGGALLFNMYTLGYTAASAAASGGDLVYARDRGFVQAIIEAVLMTLSLGWIVYRLFTASVRRSGG